MRVRPAGRHALLVEFADAEHAGAFHAEVLRRRGAGVLPPVREVVPGARTVLLDGVPERDALARQLGEWDVPLGAVADGDVVTIPVVYDGPDLAEVAGLWGVSEEDVAVRHASYTYRVAFCGFAPGFGYLAGLPEELHVPRRATPRTRVPAGAVALAGGYSAVYPRATPGGWQLIGTMPDPGVLWDVGRESAALLAPGTRVRFAAAGLTSRGSAPDPAAQSPQGLDVPAGPGPAPHATERPER
ncbi:5-oxoprolinase subunit B family protein [Streptomyces endophyticus]|uniref:Allophanate hydrolase subunit 1 n=1 Tax=Streptomyces endophyticus TaxID=714166 RepID=A0ABU6F168_9ACTN|nr:allophanate hydrolase subunit 1 [Streptomyces endophyticus]MEB8337718.1 allophanate hydrolase subunit 1 [Streptomyces endophyticus]